MKPIKQLLFHSETHGDISLESVISQIKSYLEEVPTAAYTLVIGSDSHERTESESNKRVIRVITAIIVHRKGFGGKYFWYKHKKLEVHSLREKIYDETLGSLSIATEFVPLLKLALDGKVLHYDLEIHVDVGERGQTREMVKEVIGMVTGYGFVAKMKPYAYGASYVADKHT